MPKPTRVRYYGTALFIQDYQQNRVQSLGDSTRFNQEDFKELGTINIIEIIDDAPTQDITIDYNEVGKNNAVGCLSNSAFGCRVIAVPSGTQAGSNKITVEPGCIKVNNTLIPFSGATATGNISAGNFYTVAIKNSGGTVNDMLLISGASGSAPNVPTGYTGLCQFSGSANVTQTVLDAGDIRNFKTITLDNFELAAVDITVPVKETKTGDVVRTKYIERAFVNRIDLSYAVNGAATESYSLESDNMRWFINNGKYIYTDRFTAGGVLTVLNLTYAPTVLNNGNYLLKLLKNGSALKEGVDFSVTGTTVTLSGSAQGVAGDQYVARYANNTAGQFHVINFDTSKKSDQVMAAALKHGAVELYLSDDVNNRLLRIQSCKISAALTRTPLSELGTKDPYDRPLELPCEVTVSVEITDNDLEMFARLVGYTYNQATNTITGGNEIDIDNVIKNLNLTVKIYRLDNEARAKLPAGHPNKLPLKTIVVNNIIPTGQNWSTRVDADATQTFDFRADNLSFTA